MNSSSFSDSSLRKSFLIEPGPLMLKDYLMDDLSSCSSNGFKSFARRPCCTSVRFLIEKDLKCRDSNNHNRLLRESRSNKASTTVSALQRASEAVINAVKYFSFHSVKSPLSTKRLTNRSKIELLPRSLSKKLLKKADNTEKKEVKQWKLFREYLEDKDKPSDQNTKITVLVPVTERVSTSSSSKSNTNSWTEKEFTSVILRSSSGNSESSEENDAVDEVNTNNNKVGITVGEDLMKRGTTPTNSKECHNEGKEQFSPVSVLDCPFQDEDEASSPFHRNFVPTEGTKQKVLQRNKKSESLAQLEPVNLEKRIAMSGLKDNTSDSNQIKEKSGDFLRLVKDKTSSSNYLDFKVDDLLLDFFREKFAEENEAKLLKIDEDWIRDQPRELLLGWEVEKGRKMYVMDMDRSGNWKNLDGEKLEATLELEVEIWNFLLKELLLDLVLMS